MHDWSGRWVDGPLSIAAASTNVFLFGASTTVLLAGTFPRIRIRRQPASTYTRRFPLEPLEPLETDLAVPHDPATAARLQAPELELGRAPSRAEVRDSRLPLSQWWLAAGAVVLLVAAWMITWWPLNQDFNHMHGWEHAQDAQLARMVGDGSLSRAFVPAAFPVYDVGGHYRIYTHYSALPTLLVAPFVLIPPASIQHAALRVGGMGVSLAFLAALAAFAVRLVDRRFRVLGRVLAAINAAN